MPTTFKNYFKVSGDIIYYRKKTKTTYEARYRKHGIYISRSAPTLELLKSRVVQAFRELDKERKEKAQKELERQRLEEKLHKEQEEQDKLDKVPTKFDEFAEYFFDNFYKRSVTPHTFKNTTNRYYNHIEPVFRGIEMKDLTPLSCQRLLDNLSNSGKHKTAIEIKSTLNSIFEMAKRHYIIQNNPIDIVFLAPRVQQHGKALTKDEEKHLLEATAGTPYQLMFAVALYTGLRPNEYKTAVIKDKFIIANNSKRKNGKVELKKIPISPMLRPYLVGISKLQFYGTNRIAERFRAIIAGHRLYDLRTTFYTRCQECGVTEIALKKFAGHTLGGLAEVYTDLSDEYLLKEAEKIRY